MTLYEIEAEIMNCCREEIDPETGEITSVVIDPEAFEALQMAKAQKVENIACWIKNLTAEAEAMKAEEDRLRKRRRAAENKVDSLKGLLAYACEGQRYKGVRADVQFRQTATVAVDDMDALPAEFVRKKTTTEPDKVALKKALQLGAIPGAHMEMSLSTIVR